MAEPSELLAPLRVGKNLLQHRVVMAPLTRYRADDDHVPSPLAPLYYGQRASCPGTLIITEATFIAQHCGGYANVPGIYNEAQVNAWRPVTEAVHAKGSFIFCQLWCLGRTADPSVAQREGFEMVAPSNVPLNDVPVRELSKHEIPELVEAYAKAALRAIEAGFDGVEIHAANGYMVDQFLQDMTNRREDEYGGSPENRSRFACEVADAISQAIGSDRVGIRLSPYSTFQGMKMEDPRPQFTDVITKLSQRNLAYVHVVEARIAGNQDVTSAAAETLDFAMDAWGDDRPFIVAGGYTPENVRHALESKYATRNNLAVAFGRYFLSTPDLPFRIDKGIAPNPYNRSTFYIPKSPEGYIDYEFSKEWTAAHP